jgi:hypothetical protein
MKEDVNISKRKAQAQVSSPGAWIISIILMLVLNPQ